MTLLYDIQSLLERNVTKLVSNRTLFATLLAEPITIFLVFSQVFQKLSVFLPSSSGGYLGFIAPGVLTIAVIVTAQQSGIYFVNDLNSGFLSKMLATPVARSAILLGRLMTDMLVVVAQSAIVIIAAVALGAKISAGLPGVLLILLTVAFFELALSGVFLAVGMMTRKTETLSALSGFLGLALVFLSNAMFPVSFLPSWAETVANYNPVTYVSDVTRGLFQGGLSLSTLGTAYALTGIIVVVGFAATLYQFRKVIR